MKVELLAGERKRGETSRSIQACNDYLRLGPGRSLRILNELYAENRQFTPPTSNLHTLKGWSAKYDWVVRAEGYDAALEEAKNVRHQEIMESGLALDHERVEKLKGLAGFLLDEIEKTSQVQAVDEDGNVGMVDGERHRVWLPDVKQIGSGEFAERVDIERYNSAIFSDLRGLLDDLAKETGGRVVKQDITSDGKPLFDMEAWKETRQGRLDDVEKLDDETQDG